MKGDFHIHSTGSDGLFNLELLLMHYREKEFTHIAITDHYVISDCIKNDEVLAIKKRQYGIDIIVGSEQVGKVNDEYLHLLCYFNCNADVTEPIKRLMVGQENFVKALNERVKSVMKERGIYIPDIDYSLIDARSYMPILMEVVKRTGKTPKETRKEFFELMKKGLEFEGPTKLEAKELIDEVHKSKGLVVLAHPYQFKRESIMEAIRLGIDGLEVYYPTHTEEMVNELKEIAREYDLLVTAGSDFHHPLDTVKHGNIGSVALTGRELQEFLRRLKGEKKTGDLNVVVKGYLEDMGAVVEKDDCGEHYFIDYNGRSIVANLEDLSLNSEMFRLNSSKRQSMSILKKYKVPHVEVMSLSLNEQEAITEACEYYKGNRNFVIRGDKGTCGANTFFIEDNKDDIYHAIKRICSKGIRPLISPYYEAQYEYRVICLDGKVELVIRKEKNELTGKHNISSGASSEIEKDENIIRELEKISSSVANIFGLKFAAIDIMDTAEGYKVVEFGIPNIKRFSSQSEINNEYCKKIFQKALLVKLNECC